MSRPEPDPHFERTGCDSSLHPEDCLADYVPVPVEVVENEKLEYGRLWPDGTFQGFGGWHNPESAKKEMDRNSYELKNVPAPLRPVLGRRRSTVRTEIFTAEAVPEEEKR